MGNYLAKTPLTAVIFAALWHFVMVFMPVSPGYSQALAAFNMPLLGYLFMIAYGLWISVITAIVFGNAKGKGLMLALFLSLSLFITQWISPMLDQIMFGETTGAMTRTDLLFKLAGGCVAGFLLALLASLLFKAPPPHPPSTPPKAPDKYKIKKLDLSIKLIVLPMIYCVIYFLCWYFLFWRLDAVRIYYTGVAEECTFIKAIINMLLTDSRQVPMALVKGLLYALALLPMLFRLEAKRAVFIVTSVMLLLGAALQMLIPSPVMPDAVRVANLIETSVISVVYGALASFMLHMSIHKEAAKAPIVPSGGKSAGKKDAKA